MNNITNQVAYLRTSREFPEEIHQLTVELNKSYVDISQAINVRTIGFFAVNKPSIGGESWFLTKNQKQQNLRQVYKFDDTHLIIDHGLNLASITNFVRLWGMFFDGTFWQNLPYVDVVNVTNQINVKISNTQIIITKGAGAPPAINNGLLVVEWISIP